MKRQLAAIALLLSSAAYAEDGPPTAPPNDIVVLGEGLPLPPGTPAYGVSLIDRDRLENSASGRLEDVLQDVAGLQEFRRSDSRSANPSAQGVTLRAIGGNATSRTLVLLDGIPQADPFFGYIPFNALAPDRLSVVRVTRGGGAGPFGAGAVAGTIELASATRADLPEYEGSAFYGSRNSEMLTGSFSPNLGSGYASIGGQYDRGDGFYTTPEDQRVPALPSTALAAGVPAFSSEDAVAVLPWDSKVSAAAAGVWATGRVISAAMAASATPRDLSFIWGSPAGAKGRWSRRAVAVKSGPGAG